MVDSTIFCHEFFALAIFTLHRLKFETTKYCHVAACAIRKYAPVFFHTTKLQTNLIILIMHIKLLKPTYFSDTNLPTSYAILDAKNKVITPYHIIIAVAT